jgi:hypothetical protein
MDEPIQQRIPPSGQFLDEGSTTGSRITNQWIFAGSGADAQVPGSANPGDVSGLGSNVVNLRAGYSYDMEFDAEVFGTLTQPMAMNLIVLGSTDGGVTFGTGLITEHIAPMVGTVAQPNAHLRFAKFFTPNVAADHVKVQFQRLDANADAALQYHPTLAILRITEYQL